MIPKSEEYPSLDIGYDLISNCLRDQRETARSYTNRALNIFSVGSAIVGIGLAFGFSIVQIPYVWHNLLIKIFSILPIALYLVLVRFVYIAIRPGQIQTLDDPNGLEHRLLSLSNNDFRVELIERTKNLFNQNQEMLNLKADSLTVLIPVLILEVSVTVGAVIVFSAF